MMFTKKFIPFLMFFCYFCFNLHHAFAINLNTLTQVSVLPVFVVPSDQTHLIPDPYKPDSALNGTSLGSYNESVQIAGKDTYYGTYKEFFNRAKKNLSAHLRVAQLKYKYMIEESTGSDMGTFRISTWDHESFQGEIFNPNLHEIVEPYIYISRYNQNTIAEQLKSAKYEVISEILEELEYNRDNCPYIFFTIYIMDPSPNNPHRYKPPGGGRPLNKGFVGGGYLHLSYASIRNAHIPGTHALSTIIHELGHSFGMPHVDNYLTQAEKIQFTGELQQKQNVICAQISPLVRNFFLYCSCSIMSYNHDNWIEEGVRTSAPEGTSGGKENNYYCLFENSASFKLEVKQLPGALIAENIWQLAKNNGVFNDLNYDTSYYPGYSVRKHYGYGDTILPVLTKEYSEDGYMFKYESPGEIKMRPGWSKDKAIAHAKGKFSRGYKNIKSVYNGKKLGYELFWDGNRVGYEPKWSKSKAIANCQWNKDKYHPDKFIKGVYEGKTIGYELFWDGKRVGYEPKWSKSKAIANCQWNKDKYHPDKFIKGLYEGKTLGYELFWDGNRVGYEPGWSKAQAISNCKWNIKKYTNKSILGKYEGKILFYIY